MPRTRSAIGYVTRATAQGFARAGILACAPILISIVLSACSREIERPTEVKPGNAVVVIGILNSTPEFETDIVATWENIWESERLHGSVYTTQDGLRLYELPPGTYRLYQSVAFSRPMADTSDNYIVFTVRSGEAVYVGTFAYRFIGQRARSSHGVLLGPAPSDDAARPGAFSVMMRDYFPDAVEIYNRVADRRAPVLAKRLAHREHIPCLPRPMDGKRTTTHPRGMPTFEQRCPEGKAGPADLRRRIIR